MLELRVLFDNVYQGDVVLWSVRQETFSVVLLGLDEVSFNSFYFVSSFSQFECVVAEGFPEVI